MHAPARAFAAVALVMIGCTSQPSASDSKTENDPPKPEVTTATPPVPEPEPEVDEFEIGPGPRGEPLTTAVIDAPIPTEQPPLDFWKNGDAACEAGGKLDGAAPPEGTEIRCIDAEYRWTGMEARFHDNGKLSGIGRRQQSRMIGVWQWFHESGNKAAEHTYVDGQLHGTQRRWADNGQEIEYGEYRGGRPWGLFIDHDEQGNELGRAQLDKGTGVLVNASISRRTESDYVDGLLHGTHREFDANKQKLEESLWSGGKMHGKQTRWDADGNKHSEGQWKNGEQHGQFTRYAAGQIIEQSVWIDGKEISRQLFAGGEALAPLPARTECDTDPGLSKYLASARGEGLPDDHACVTRVPMFPGVIMLGSFAYDRGCMGADFVVDCKLVTPPPSAADLLARAGWAKATGEQRIEIAKEYVREFALGNNGNVVGDPSEPQWKVLEDGGVEGVVWVAEPAGMRRGVDKDEIRYTFAVDGTVKREVLQHVSARDD
jgi:antitoxin component YwqK of YwqJK toxin-antitoxin module